MHQSCRTGASARVEEEARSLDTARSAEAVAVERSTETKPEVENIAVAVELAHTLVLEIDIEVLVRKLAEPGWLEALCRSRTASQPVHKPIEKRHRNCIEEQIEEQEQCLSKSRNCRKT
jgi:hypothetical protein